MTTYTQLNPRLFAYGIKAVLIRDWIYPGWNRRRDDGRLEPIHGWRYVLHRILWGFNRLTYIPDADAWITLDWDVAP